MGLREYSREELRKAYEGWKKEYDAWKAKGLKLDMSRGKPSTVQLDLSMDMITGMQYEDYFTDDGVDIRNYGMLEGLPKCRALFAQLLGVQPENVIVGGNSSLNLMYDAVARSMILGVCGGTPWMKQGRVKFLCPVPGYDRHFAICEQMGIEMVNIPMREDGPDMDLVEQLVNTDPAVKGIWCVPKYSNPSGITYSDEVVRRFAALTPAAPDFRIYWDDAYAVHDLYEEGGDKLLGLYEELKKNGKEDMAYLFTSTSKITFAGAGVAAMAASERNIQSISSILTIQTIGHDKVKQAMLVKYFQNKEGILAHMKKHAAIMRPKFEAVLGLLRGELAPLEIARWTEPKGGYFVSVDVLPGCAKRVVALCKEAGVVLTGAGASFPYQKDPQDANIRLAPSYPPVEELTQAMQLFCLAVKLAAAEKLLEN